MSDLMNETSSQPSKGHRFKPGQSGNPKGRPAGLANSEKLRQAIEKDLPEVLQAVVNAAKGGDMTAAKLLLDRALPAVKPIDQPVVVSLPKTDKLVERGEAIMQATVDGELAPSQAGTLLQGLGEVAKLRQAEELAARIEALEKSGLVEVV